MDDAKRFGGRLMATTALAALLAVSPFAPTIDPQTGAIAVGPAAALAKGENSGSGSGGSDNSGSGGGGGDNSGSGSSGSGGGNSGSGSGGGGDDDNSGSGSGGSDNSGSGSSDDDDHDHSGPGGGDDDPDEDEDDNDDRDEDEDRSGRRGGGDRADDRGPKVEIFGDNIEITFADGTKEEIENGVYERKNVAGRTVEERPATQADFDRLQAAAASGDLDTATRESGSGVVKTEVFGNSIEVTFADGTKEEIENGIYERKNTAGITVEERPATQADFDRLAAIAGGGPAGGSAPGGATGGPATGEREFRLSDGTKIEVVGDNIEVTYSDGWKEEIEGGRYELKDPAGNTVVERPATAGDRNRLEAQLPS